MSRKKKERFAPVQLSLYSLVGLVLFWITVTALAFVAGYGLGNTGRFRAPGNRSPAFERSGESSPHVLLTFPDILGKAETDFRKPEAVPEAPVSATPSGGRTPSRTEPEPEKVPGDAGTHARTDPGSEAEAPPASGDCLLQVASFREASAAERFEDALEHQGYRCFTTASVHPRSGEPLYRVFVGPFSTTDQAEQAKARLQATGGFQGIFIRSGNP